MTSQIPAAQFAGPAPADRLERAAAALTAHGFACGTSRVESGWAHRAGRSGSGAVRAIR